LRQKEKYCGERCLLGGQNWNIGFSLRYFMASFLSAQQFGSATTFLVGHAPRRRFFFASR